ncbi:WcaI family glycosyltransferase [Chitinophaga solisilvae]|uniref:WcaI family glycosyltransferase n=1 Tax=Chitinophaga solisilvae TaxID=1233460 RepID=A0A3S1B1Y2_9BACT|nr:WcaI family glycosyltransferase [Chitinophaga solisilvae]NSL85361.1 WcaI family glycosyltransferase [Chitinophaga solisilvae]
MRLLLITGNFSPEPNGTGKYNGEMIRWLAGRGYDCTVITTYPYYPEWKVQAPYTSRKYRFTKEVQQFDTGRITVYRCPQYVPVKPSGKKRILQDATFAVAAAWQLLLTLPRQRFDIVMTVVPSFILGLLAVFYKKVRGAKFLYHIQDMQIEAARDLRMIRSPWLLQRLFGMERFIMRRADVISSISDGMIRKIGEKAGREVMLFPNWVDVSLFHPLENKEVLKAEYGFKASDRIVLYSGAIGEKQGLEAVLHAAASFRDNPAVKFLICGSGPYRQQLQLMAESLQLQNTIFMPLQPFEKFNRFLNMADVHLVIQKGHAADLVMPSKLTTIMAVGGLAIVTANPGTSLHELITRHEMGIVAEADDQSELNNAISKAIAGDADIYAQNARRYALEHLSVDKIMPAFEQAAQN